jgi:arabinofuranosyltransferase
MATPDAAPARWSSWLVCAAAALLFAWALYLHRHFFHDDAFIVLRYVGRVLDGRGLTWNDGERVEGFSSPAWLAQLAVLVRLGIDPPLAARGLGLGYALAVFALWLRARAAPAGLLALVTVPGFALWTWGGLETMSACYWLLVATHRVRRMQDEPLSRTEALGLGGALALLALSRPEGIAVAVALLAAAWPSRRQPAYAVAALALAATSVGYESFRFAYFGDVIANGARAKTLGLPLLARIENATIYLAGSAPQWLGTAVLAGWMLATTPRRRGLLWLLLPLGPLVLLIFAGGGDHMLGARFLLAPVALLAFTAGLAPPSPRRGTRHATLALAVLAAFWQMQLGARNPAPPDPAVSVGEPVGRALAAMFPRGTWVATATAGSVPYFAPALSFLDTLGLNDRHIARQPPAALPLALQRSDSWTQVPGHLRGDGAYLLARRPDLVMFGGANGDLSPWFVSDYQILLSPAFRANYAPWRWFVAVPASARPWLADELDPATGRLPITLYVRHDSPAAAAVAAVATPLRPLWEKP